MIDLWPTVPTLLAANNYMVLATATPSGEPWVTPLFFGAIDEHELVWVSSAESRHSRNIATSPVVAATVFDSRAALGRAEAIYLEGTADRLSDDRLDLGLDVLNSRLPVAQRLDRVDVNGPDMLRAYRLRVSAISVLIRGGDPRFDNPLDARLGVEPPA